VPPFPQIQGVPPGHGNRPGEVDPVQGQAEPSPQQEDPPGPVRSRPGGPGSVEAVETPLVGQKPPVENQHGGAEELPDQGGRVVVVVVQPGDQPRQVRRRQKGQEQEECPLSLENGFRERSSPPRSSQAQRAQPRQVCCTSTQKRAMA
jgi:hypothetical protein